MSCLLKFLGEIMNRLFGVLALAGLGVAGAGCLETGGHKTELKSMPEVRHDCFDDEPHIEPLVKYQGSKVELNNRAGW